MPYGTRAPKEIQHHLPAPCSAGLLFPPPGLTRDVGLQDPDGVLQADVMPVP